MKLWQWLTATVTAGLTIGTFLMGLVYSQTQGKALENRVTVVESQIKSDEQQQSADLTHIRDKIDRVYEILLRNRRDRLGD